MSYSEILYPLGANNDVLEVDNTLPRGIILNTNMF